MRIVVLVGLPGSGKSTYLKRMGVEGLSSDAIRKWLVDDETDQSIHDGRVWERCAICCGSASRCGVP